MNVKKFVKKDIENIWKKYKKYDFINYPPVSVELVPENSIIFIGLNPSLSDEESKSIKNNNILTLDSYKLFPKKEKNHKYFKKFPDIANKLNKNWGHIDLLYLRETNQKKIKEIMKPKNGHGYNFIYEQLMVSKKLLNSIINNANPKLFVVNNSLSRRFLGQENSDNKKENIWMGFDFIWEKEIGTYKYKNIPFYFTSMLTGQRALDNGSLERLIWQIELFTNQEKM